MRYVVQFRGSPLAEVDTLVQGYLVIRDEFKQRWPRAFYGPQEAAAHGLSLVGTPELTPEEASELRKSLRDSKPPKGTLADALRLGTS